MKILAVFLALAIAAVAHAHNAPSGWQYDAACCSQRDCVPIAARFVRVGPEGFTVTIPAGAHPFVKDQALSFSMPHRSDRVRPSGDAEYHACINPWRVPLCLYVPPGGV